MDGVQTLVVYSNLTQALPQPYPNRLPNNNAYNNALSRLSYTDISTLNTFARVD